MYVCRSRVYGVYVHRPKDGRYNPKRIFIFFSEVKSRNFKSTLCTVPPCCGPPASLPPAALLSHPSSCFSRPTSLLATPRTQQDPKTSRFTSCLHQIIGAKVLVLSPSQEEETAVWTHTRPSRHTEQQTRQQPIHPQGKTTMAKREQQRKDPVMHLVAGELFSVDANMHE